MQWQAVACSEIGTKHIQKGIPCQDYGSYQILSGGQVVIGAVSDGLGSASRSELGSKKAVEIALIQLSKVASELTLNQQPPEQERARKMFTDLVIIVQQELEKVAHQQNCLVDDLACTLLAFIATPTWLAAMQVGDGSIVVRPYSPSNTDEEYELLFRPDKSGYVNELTPVTESRAIEEMQTDVRSNLCEFICVATDGVENIALLKRENWKPFPGFFSPLEQCMFSEKSLTQKQEEIRATLNTDKLNQKTDDDKTLLLCIYGNIPSRKTRKPIQQIPPQDNSTSETRSPETQFTKELSKIIAIDLKNKGINYTIRLSNKSSHTKIGIFLEPNQIPIDRRLIKIIEESIDGYKKQIMSIETIEIYELDKDAINKPKILQRLTIKNALKKDIIRTSCIAATIAILMTLISIILINNSILLNLSLTAKLDAGIAIKVFILFLVNFSLFAYIIVPGFRSN
ncbi:MAG: protein phosphatase 2C domain-containing protein [Roseofilum sp. SBFL]|uniref:PP2C family serine/threonine-protein phosphatase n=1 Tax=unclassified Roseofilum TaxID=2620099 RepID=UPI001B2E55EF|nr:MULTISPECIES: PP2C family serine/threonine-protein phosphatase [unclassified Roseofilum]MBP0014335.1 protein phosphatase 2C domain-containing protein [Roseofilum sp. SID3]MBP0024579.1 protein phosphatase 2C domain-containing protein [Roseofilum sp. SID2]MBP0037900.1 protein phosphatase 2C domain-containing protein [Roseofilum sp. SID1]MBP0040736.1 protein phosphatase 2C domain-containing protein [Roseofilum sp. SBFL]